MSNVVMMQRERAQEAEGRRYLGPAVVTCVRPHELEVRLKTGAVVRAEAALAFTYEPACDDVVLVIGDADGHYVIGVLQGKGRAVLEIPGDVNVRAVGGVLRLSGDKGVEIASPELSMRVGKLLVLADAAVQRFSSLRQRVTELLSVHAGQSHTVVEGSSHAQSKSATILSEEKVTINGKAVYLG